MRTFRIGTITERLKAADLGPPEPMYPTNSNIETYFKFAQFDNRDRPVLGFLGLSAKDVETLLTCYQMPDPDTLLAVMSEPRKVRERVAEGGTV